MLPNAKYACPFCDTKHTSLLNLTAHVVHKHKEIERRIGDYALRFRVYKSYGLRRALCVCGKRFICDLKAEPSPFFRDWAVKTQVHLTTLTTHFRRVGGFYEHVEQIKAGFLLDRLDSLPVYSTTIR